MEPHGVFKEVTKHCTQIIISQPDCMEYCLQSFVYISRRASAAVHSCQAGRNGVTVALSNLPIRGSRNPVLFNSFAGRSSPANVRATSVSTTGLEVNDRRLTEVIPVERIT